MPLFYVVWSGTIEAEDHHAAENLVENAIASTPALVELEDCNATPTDLDIEVIDPPPSISKFSH